MTSFTRKNLSLFIMIITIILPLCSLANDNVIIQGFISQGYLKSTANNFYANTEDGSFEFNELGINFTAKAADRLHLGMQFFARDLGRLDNDEPRINWAYGDYRFTDTFGIRAGMMKLAFGLYNEVRDLDMLRVNILYPNGVYNESWRDTLASLIGIGAYGNINVPFVGKMKYLFQDGINSISPDGGAMDLLEDQMARYQAGTIADVEKVHVDHFNNISIFAEGLFNIDGLRTGLTHTDLDMDATTNLSYNGIPLPQSVLSVHCVTFVYSLEYTFKDIILASEYVAYTWNLKLAGIKVPEYTSVSWYASVSYSVTDWLELYTAYSVYYARDDDKEGKKVETTNQAFRGWLKEIILAVRFDINTNWLLKLETRINDGADVLLNMDQDTPEKDENSDHLKYPYKRHWVLFAAKISYNF